MFMKLKREMMNLRTAAAVVTAAMHQIFTLVFSCDQETDVDVSRMLRLSKIRGSKT